MNLIKASQKLDQLSTSVFSLMAQKKSEWMKKGLNFIDLSIGSPDQEPPMFIKQALSEFVLQDNQYGYSMKGTEEFHEAVVHYYQNRFQVSLKTDNVLQLIGSQEGLAHLALAYLDPGDVAIVPDPGYPIYSASVHMAGAEVYALPLKEENNFYADLESIPSSITKRAKMMILNYPGNPIASLADEAYFKQVIQFGLKHNILIVHDFAYSELIFDQQPKLSILAMDGASEIAIEFNSLSKSFNMAGCRIAYLVGAAHLLEPLAIIKSHADYGVFYPIQKAAALALKSDYSFLEKHAATYQERRDIFVEQLHGLNWRVRIPEGGMFIWAKLPELDIHAMQSHKLDSGWDSLSFAMKALELGVVVTPGHAFGREGEGYIRIALVEEKQALVEAAQKLAHLALGNLNTNLE